MIREPKRIESQSTPAANDALQPPQRAARFDRDRLYIGILKNRPGDEQGGWAQDRKAKQPMQKFEVMFDSILKFVYLVEFIVISIVRTAHTRADRRLTVAVDRKTLPDMIMLALGGMGMLVPLIYIFSTSLDFANYILPTWTGWLGAAVFAVAIWLLWRSHVDLGRSWPPTLGIRDDHP